ncbi:MAG TPA: prolyl oligopeptidase family serine peptidase [Vicinamibacterales bacterium]|nr:prolyl oligopeptidase family serine peptidase [Vicinamibacterales bacterium]HJO38050.1 prolyl oligopeptidase family serine peptidase [Vicinamibacterales bacterium]
MTTATRRKPQKPQTPRRHLRSALAVLLLAAAVVTPSASAQVDPSDSYVLPPPSVQDLFERDKNLATLDRLSPGGTHFLIPRSDELSSLESLSRRTLRLGMLELMPEVDREWRLATYGIRGYDVYSLADRRTWSIDLDVPDGIYLSDAIWSPDGRRLAFLAHLADGTQVWTADVATGAAEPLSDARVMATLAARAGFGVPSVPSRMIQWMSDGSVLALTVPASRGLEPDAGAVPTGPVVRRSREEATPTRTLPFLLRTEHDADLFRHYTTAQLVRLRSGQEPEPIGEPAMYMSIALSPDGRRILRERLVEPFSFIVGYSSFGRDLEVLDLDGSVVSTIRQVPLHEPSGRDNRPDADLPREVVWRPDSGLAWLAPGPKPGDDIDDADSDRQDRILTVAAPFDVDDATVVASTSGRYSGLGFAADGEHAFAEIAEDGDRRIVAYGLPAGSAELVLAAYDPDDVLELPGELLTRQDGNGVASVITSTDGASAYLEGPGYRESFTPQPFVDRVDLASGAATRVFEGSVDAFDQPLVPLDDDFSRMIVSRETKTAVPDSYLWSAEGAWENLTGNADPYAEITAARRIDFDFTRRDGLVVQSRISLPTDYRPGQRVPAIFWTYPREYASPEEYVRGAIRARNHNAFTPLSFLRWSDIWLTQGYAVVYPDIPILGTDGRFNDHFVADTTETMYAAIRKVDQMGYVDVDRIGHGGHSYGAFTTANLLAHTPYFKAGIAGDGAYNRTLTPMAFQGERRFIWDAPTTYLEISPYFYADQIHSPLLMYHGEQDNNSGTFLIQSERMMQALTGLGKTAALYVYPFESHGPRAKENYLDLWARWLDWFDTYVKGGASELSDNQGQ